MKNESKVLAVVNGRTLRFDGKITSIKNSQNSVFAQKNAIAEIHPYSQDDLYLYLAASASFIKEIAIALNEKYEEDKVLYYALAKHSPSYAKITKLQESLETEINIKRFLGIFIAAEYKSELSDYIVNAFIKKYPELGRALDANLNDKIIDTYFMQPPVDLPDTSDINCLVFMPLAALYIALTRHSIDSPKIKSLVLTAKVIFFHRNNVIACVKENIDNDSWSDRGYVHKTGKRKAIEALSNTKYMSTLISLINAINCDEDIEGIQHDEHNFLCNWMENVFKMNTEDADAANSLHYISIFSRVAEQFNYCAGTLFGEKEITPELRKKLYRIITEFENIALKGENDCCNFSFSIYLVAMLFYVLFEELATQRELYFKNNSETQFYALHDLEQKIEELEGVIDSLENENENLKATIAEYNDKLSKVISTPKTVVKDISKEAIATYEASIALKNKEIEKLKQELEKAEAKNKEVDLLREMVFEIKMCDLPESKTPLVELVKGKKIVVVGGHVNWQNKMKAAYPDMIILDGHLANVDIAMFKDADLVLFNTANMSHKLYHKLIDAFRSNNVEYDYLGRITNSALLEQEIAYLIEKHL